MKTVAYVLTGLAALAGISGAAQAALVNDFELNGSLTDSAGSAILTNNGGILGSSGITFARNDGPSITGLAVSWVYTLDMAFSLDDDGTDARYRKIFDFKNLTSDNGLYSLYSALDFYPRSLSPTSDFTPGRVATVTLSRDADGNVLGYVNGVQKIQFADTQADAVIDSVLTLLTDDGHSSESSSGYVDYLRVYNQALTPSELPAQTPSAGAVPEPASWAMMLGGFGLVGGAMRNRRHKTAVRFG